MNTDHDYFTAYSFGGVRIASAFGDKRPPGFLFAFPGCFLGLRFL
jgi:hypothetical protein